MKTKEEIEQLAEQYYISDYNTEEEQSAAESGYIDGYLQCQEDMAEKKYTEEDVRNAFNAGDAWGRADYNTYFSILINPNQPFPDEDEYINSLNKQD